MTWILYDLHQNTLLSMLRRLPRILASSTSILLHSRLLIRDGASRCRFFTMGPPVTAPSTATPSSSVPAGPLRVPEGVRGMTKLDKDLFSTEITFPTIAISARDVSRVRGCTHKFWAKNLGKIKPVMEDPESPEKRILVFNPNLVQDEETRDRLLSTAQSVLDNTTLEWSERKLTVDFSCWDTRSMFRAVLPDGMDYSSYTQTGHLIHCNFRDELIPYRHIIGEILLNKISNCRTVVLKPDVIKTVYRTLDVELIAGEPDYIVETVEDGLRFKMDFTKVFWNSRLSQEHLRVRKHIGKNSLVFDACAGIGPFALPALKKSHARLILANDLNPDSVYWMQENIRLNKIKDDAITIYNKDAVSFLRGEVARILREEALLPVEKRPSDAHIIMNLPAMATEFLPAFRGLLRSGEKGDDIPSEMIKSKPFDVIVYCYLFAKAHEDVPDSWYAERALHMVKEKLKDDDVVIRSAHEVRGVSSRKFMYCVECIISWSHLLAEPLQSTTEKNGSVKLFRENADGENVEETETQRKEETDEPKEKKAKLDGPAD